MSVAYTVKPITDFTIFTTPEHSRKGVQFQASWSQTLKDLGRELDYLDAKDVVLELGVMAGQIRLDGMLRADAKVTHPGVRISFQSKHGDLSYTCDTYEARWRGQMPDWQANVRAIVLSLKALRDVDRHGALKGEQYVGSRKELPAGSGATPLGGMTREHAIRLLHEVAEISPQSDLSIPWRAARARAHPDRNDGHRILWDQVEQAGKVLGLI